MQRSVSAQWSRIIGVVFILLLLAVGTRTQVTDLTVVDYCRLTEALMELSVREWLERIVIAEQRKSGRREVLSELEEVTKQHRKLQQEKFSEFGTDARAYLHFASDHKPEIESYLEENPEAKTNINTLKDRLKGLIQQFESAMSYRQRREQK